MATNNRLAHEKIIKLLFSLAIPSIIAQLVNILYNIVDRIYIGQMANGTIAMAALSVTLPIVTFVSAFTQLVGVGGAPLCAMIENSDQHSKDYSLLKECMRPGHSDYPAYVKYHGYNDVRGGGHFSGRLTAPIVFAGSVAKQILRQKGIIVGAHIQSIKDVYDDSFGVDITCEDLQQLTKQQYPTLNSDVFLKMQNVIEDARMKQDSVGGTIECAIINVPAGLGNPFFDSIESHLSPLLFSIPAVKSVSFGMGEKMSELYGHEANDCYYYEGEKVKTKTNHNGGITGGISNGMPIVFKVAIKPTPSISQVQSTINVKTKENTKLEITGRHDPCIVPRAVVVVESMAAIGILDMMKDI